MPRTTRRRVALVALLAVSSAGCEIIADFDRTKIDAGDTFDAAPVDATFPEGGRPDVAAPDAAEAAAAEAGDAGPGTDGGDATTTADAADAGNDANVADANVGDANVADTNVADTNLPDTNAPDARDSAVE